MNAILSFIGFVIFSTVCICLFMASQTPEFFFDSVPVPQSVSFNGNTCMDIREHPITETKWGDVSNGYYCGHE